MNRKREDRIYAALLSDVFSNMPQQPEYQPGAIWQPDFKAQTPANPLPLTPDMLSNAKPESPKGKQS